MTTVLRLPGRSLRAAPVAAARRLHTSRPSLAPAAGEGKNKICAVPFHFTQQEAQSRLNIAALLATATIPNVIYATILRFLPPLPASIHNFLLEFGIGGASVQHIATKAVLWPTWRVRAVFEAKAQQMGGKGSRGKVWFAVREGSVAGTTPNSVLHLPDNAGNSFSPLSLLPFSTQALPETLPTYDPSLDLAQLVEVGTPEVTAVPFGAYTPFDVFERMKKELGRITQWEGIKVDLDRDLDVQMMTAHPIYFPLYIGEFEFTPDQHDATGSGKKGKKSRRITIVMDAHDEDPDVCRLAVPRPYGGPNQTGDETYYINSPAFIADAALQLSPQTLSNRSLGGSLAASLSEAAGRWLCPPAIPPYGADDNQLDRTTAVYTAPQSPLVRVEQDAIDARGEAGVDWDDERIQAWSGEERQESEEWIEKGQVRFAMQAQLDTMKSLEAQSGSQITTLKLNRPGSGEGRRSVLPSIEKVSMGDAIAQASDDVRKATEEWEAARPKWVKRYEANKERETGS
ncbi:hypothetical protein QFC19_002827 [Naganishia cerealis]|uniref:Uncharacterized protein n=1 Tax=Naganishia cerealis TaxID=610337 RepID=A0ACC2W6B2_9TREE|nr:hypothetical protein QFC19_002827 [Naganishia cerealis]